MALKNPLNFSVFSVKIPKSTRPIQKIVTFSINIKLTISTVPFLHFHVKS